MIYYFHNIVSVEIKERAGTANKGIFTNI